MNQDRTNQLLLLSMIGVQKEFAKLYRKTPLVGVSSSEIQVKGKWFFEMFGDEEAGLYYKTHLSDNNRLFYHFHMELDDVRVVTVLDSVEVESMVDLQRIEERND